MSVMHTTRPELELEEEEEEEEEEEPAFEVGERWAFEEEDVEEEEDDNECRAPIALNDCDPTVLRTTTAVLAAPTAAMRPVPLSRASDRPPGGPRCSILAVFFAVAPDRARTALVTREVHGPGSQERRVWSGRARMISRSACCVAWEKLFSSVATWGGEEGRRRRKKEGVWGGNASGKRKKESLRRV